MRAPEAGRYPRLAAAWNRGQRGWPEQFPLVQFPNGPLLLALGGGVVAMLTEDAVHDYGRATFYAGVAAWAWLELAEGDNLYRRVLGAAGVGYVIVRVGAGIGG